MIAASRLKLRFTSTSLAVAIFVMGGQAEQGWSDSF
jgi:hypothetical protein